MRNGAETTNVYTQGNLPKGGPARWKALEDPNFWKPNRRALHKELIAKAKTQSANFAKAAQGQEPTIYAMRGNTAAGKSRAIKGNIPELEAPINATPNQAHRAINPDNFKTDLYAAEPNVTLTSTQVHSESSTLASVLQKEVAGMKTGNGKAASMLVDKRLAGVADVQEYAALAKQTGRKLNVYDVDAPLEVSLAGVLERVPGGVDPIPPFEVIAQGFLGVRINREAVIALFESDKNLGKYELFATLENGSKVKVAEVKNGQKNVLPQHKELFDGLIVETSELMVDALRKTKITNELIQGFTKNMPTERAATVSSILKKWIGKTWEQAINEHAATKVNK